MLRLSSHADDREAPSTSPQAANLIGARKRSEKSNGHWSADLRTSFNLKSDYRQLRITQRRLGGQSALSSEAERLAVIMQELPESRQTIGKPGVQLKDDSELVAVYSEIADIGNFLALADIHESGASES